MARAVPMDERVCEQWAETLAAVLHILDGDDRGACEQVQLILALSNPSFAVLVGAHLRRPQHSFTALAAS